MDNSLSEVTQGLKRWESQINLVLNNAHAVYGSKPLQFLADYEGVTRQRAEEAKTCVARILDEALQIQAVVGQAREIHKSIMAFLPQAEKLERIKMLLEGASITLEVTDTSQSCDLLAETSAPKIAPEALLRRMQAKFAVVKKNVDEMTRTISEKENLAADADSFFTGLQSGPDVESIRKQVLAACRTLLKDPLGSDSASASVKRLMQEIKGAEQRERDQAAELQSLTLLSTRRQEALEALEEREIKIQEELLAKVQGASTLSHAALVDRLRSWLKSLLDHNQHAGVRLASLRKWTEEAVALEKSMQKQANVDSGKIQERDELKGRFLALKAKSADLRLSERADVVQVIAEITAALRRPSNIEKASRSLAELSHLLLAK